MLTSVVSAPQTVATHPFSVLCPSTPTSSSRLAVLSPLIEDLPRAKISPVQKHVEADASNTANDSRRMRDHGRRSDKTASSSGSRRNPQQGSVCDYGRDEDGDIDSVVLGSRDSTVSAAFREDGAEGTGGHDSLPMKGSKGGAQDSAKSPSPEGEECAPSKPKKDDRELYFDPVLDCYYDRVADKYYGLR